MKRLGPVLACLLALSACVSARPIPPERAANPDPSPRADTRSGQAADLVFESARALRELRAETRQQILDYALEDAQAVIVLPGIYQAGFFYSVHGGSGVLVARTADGSWGAPVFVGVGGAGVGIQIGLEKQRLVLVIKEQEMLTRILKNGLSFDTIAKYDVLGVREETGHDSLVTERPVTAFTDGVGLMAGVAMRGAVLLLNEGLTRAYYGPENGADNGTGGRDARAVLQTRSAPGHEVFELWAALSVNLPPELITRVRRP